MKDLKTKSDKIGYVYDTFEAAYDMWKKEIEVARKAVKYYVGESYTEDQKRNLKMTRLPKIENNICKPKVDLLTGIERETRVGTKAFAIENGDVLASTGIDLTMEYIKNNNSWDATSSRVFKDGAIHGLGNYWVEPQLAKDFTIDVRITREPLGSIIWDPESIAIDPNEDAEFMFRQKFMSPGKVASVYKLNEKTMHVDLSERGDLPRMGVEDGSYYRNASGDRNISMYKDSLNGRVRVIEMWYKKYKDVAYFIDGETGQVIQSPLPIKKAEAVAERYADSGYEMVVKRDYEMHVLTVSGHEVLEDKKSPYSHNMFPAVPSYAYVEDDGEVIHKFGVIKNLFDLQDEKNSRHTMTSQILKTAPIGGGFFKKNAADVSQLNSMGGANRWVGVNRIDDIKERGYGYLPVLNQISSLEEITEQDAKEVTGLNDPMLGIPTGAKESGLAAQVRIRQGTRTVQELFDNHDKAKLTVMRMAFMLARQYFDRKKFLRILGSMTSDMGEQKAQVIADAMLKGDTLMQYDIKLDKGENSITERNSTFLKTMELMQLAPEYRMALLPYAIKLTNHPDREEILQAVGIQTQKLNTQNAIELMGGAGASAPKATNGKQNTRQQIAE